MSTRDLSTFKFATSCGTQAVDDAPFGRATETRAAFGMATVAGSFAATQIASSYNMHIAYVSVEPAEEPAIHKNPIDMFHI